jgi:hypothetical protein|tara:strand:- start:4452 stop:4667 length:216 start_codon:yes stop_codon:yes gene_type:complete
MEKLDRLITNFQDKRASHPQLSALWISYLTIKKNKLIELERRAEHALENMNTVSDITLENVLTIYLLNDII